MTETTAPSIPPPGAIPVEKLYPGLRGHLQKDEHVLWQGKGSGRAFGALNRALLIRLGLLAIGAVLLIILMLQGERPAFNWVAWILGGLLLARVLWFFWRTSATPSRQAAMLTTRRVVSVDMQRPLATWIITRGGEGRADGQMIEPHPIVITGTKERGHIRLNRGSQKMHAYPPFIIFNAEKPLEVAEKIRKTLQITMPIEDRTK